MSRYLLSAVDITTDLTLGVLERVKAVVVVTRSVVELLVEDWSA